MKEADPSAFNAVDENDPDYFIRFLDARTSIEGENQVKRLIATLLEPGDGLSVLDVGSGTGDDTCQIAARVAPNGKVVGVDRSAGMVEEARKRAAGSALPVEFIEGDAQALAFADASFDRCRAERVLMHVADPLTAIREMVRVTRPGGLVVVSEIDCGTNFINSSNGELTHRLARGLSDDLVNGTIGRHLHRYFVQADLANVRCVTNVVMNSVAFLRVLLNHRLERMVQAGHTTAAEVTKFWDELEEGERKGWLCCGVVCFTVVGHRRS